MASGTTLAHPLLVFCVTEGKRPHVMCVWGIKSVLCNRVYGTLSFTAFICQNSRIWNYVLGNIF